ncbi:MAG: YeeE/YedE family protein [Anaerolineales bacterium]|nr:YeeE/YedE family protein [Anaerolineales bacterium]
MNSAFRDIILMKDFTLFKAVVVALMVEMVGFGIMAMTGLITLAPPPLILGANIIGGFIFGIGMALAGGCASGITYRFGEGMVGAMSAVIGFSISAMATRAGILLPLSGPLKTIGKISTADDKSVTLANIFGLPHWVVAFGIPIIIILIWVYLARRNPEESFSTGKASLSEKIFKRGWNWLVTGIVIGLIGVISFPLSAATGRNYPLGITAGWSAILQTIVTEEMAIINWGALLIVGAVIGAAIAALIAGEFKLRAPAPAVLIQTFFGGALMGFGSTTAGGCNIGHILSGVPQLSIGSLVAGTCIVLGGWVAAYFLFMRTSKA